MAAGKDRQRTPQGGSGVKTVNFYEYRTIRAAVIVGELGSRWTSMPADQFDEAAMIDLLVKDQADRRHAITEALPRAHYVRKFSREVDLA
jgi:hypothetical protein